MPDHYIYNYSVIRIIPHVEREEFINAGVIVICPPVKFLKAKTEIDENRLKALFPEVDTAEVKNQLNRIEKICEGGIESGELGKLSQRERFHWLTSPKSTIIQPSPVHTGSCSDPEEVLDRLMNNIVRLKMVK